MSDANDEAAGIGAADPVTGVAAGGDDLAQDEVLAAAEVRDGDVDYEAGDPEALRAEADDLVVNDAVAGETVEPGAGDGNDGPTGGAPAEIAPDEPRNELQPDGIDLDDRDEDAF